MRSNEVRVLIREINIDVVNFGVVFVVILPLELKHASNRKIITKKNVKSSIIMEHI